MRKKEGDRELWLQRGEGRGMKTMMMGKEKGMRKE